MNTLLLTDPRFHRASFSMYTLNINEVNDENIIYLSSVELSRAARNLNAVQRKLSYNMSSKSDKQMEKINPKNILLKYKLREASALLW